MSGTARLILAWVVGFTALPAWCQSIEVLWYTYADPGSVYVQTIQRLANVVHTLPKTGGLRWKLTFFGPRSPVPAFGNYNVLVIHSGEPYHTGRPSADPGKADTERMAAPDFSGILRNRAAIAAARGERTFITGSDADVHTIAGDSGNAPPHPSGLERRVFCSPALVGRSCWDGALGHLVNAVNWAGSGRGLGIVSLVAGEFPGAHWWLHHDSFLRAELAGFVTMWGDGKKRENTPAIPAAAQGYPLNAGLTSRGLSNWKNSFHAGFSHSIPGYVSIVDSTLYPATSVAIATTKFASGGTRGPQAPASTTDSGKHK